MLNTRDLWRLSDAIKQIRSHTALDALVWSSVECIQDLVHCDWASVSLASPRFTTPTRFWSPQSRLQTRLVAECPTSFYVQHPNWRAFWSRLRPEATELLQLSTPTATASLPIHHEVFKPLSISNLLGVTLPGSSMFAVAAIRDRARPFSGRDALLLEVVSDHLASAARALRGAVAPASRYAADDGLAGRVELVAVDPLGKVIGQSPGAGSTMARFFASPRAASELPETVGTWLAAVPPEPVLCVVSGRRRLELRRFQPFVRPGYCLVLFEEDLPADPWRKPPELTPREAEIVRWVTTGKTNAEISCILAISARTVQKHLENVFAKLGVPTRTALVSEVLQRAAL